ncbi:hypothetical protein CBR_g3254 [Chara braunii]|uniref:Uncharacterized protein n=1 Tax=Chara braunii TaxID=69332 RepID=A0A388KF71_CHABU|nr:hypothetical protein CBR_g3254 [Chara braunii]|eukprot:GBG68712.1 hypothetical protein CBR_g3254 [Chara braunii]
MRAGLFRPPPGSSCMPTRIVGHARDHQKPSGRTVRVRSAKGRAVVDGKACQWCTARAQSGRQSIRQYFISHGSNGSVCALIRRRTPAPPLRRSTLELWAPRAVPLQARQARARFCSPSSSRLLASAPSGASSTCSLVHVAVVDLHASTVHVLLRPRAHRCRVADEMAPRNASGKGRKDSGAGDGGETQKGRGHVPKSKRQRVGEASSEHTEDFQPDEVVMVDAQGTAGAMRLGFGRDGVSREQLSALKQSLVVGAAGALQRTPKAAGVVMTEVRVPRQLPAVVGQGQPRQPLTLQQTGTSGGGKTQSRQKGDATASGTRTAAADHSSRSGLAEGAAEDRVDDVRRDKGRRDEKWEGDDLTAGSP